MAQAWANLSPRLPSLSPSLSLLSLARLREVVAADVHLDIDVDLRLVVARGSAVA